MNEDGSHPGIENRVSPMAEHGGPSLDSETGSDMLGKSVENSMEAVAGNSVSSRSVGIQSKISEMHGDLIRRSPYRLWMSSGPPVVGNVDWRDQGSSREGSIYWPSVFPVSSLPGIAATGKNVTFDTPQQMSVCSTDASTASLGSTVERIVAPMVTR